MLFLVIALLVLSLVLITVGVVVKALLWLAVLGLIGFLVTAVIAGMRHRIEDR